VARPKVGETANKKRQYAIWLGIPEQARKVDEKTQKAFSVKYCVTEKTLMAWRKDPEVQAIAKDALKILGGGDTMEVINVMVALAKTPDPKMFNDRKMFLEWQGQVGNKRVDGGKVGKFEVTFKEDGD